ncbi:hypothetical protein SKAU_G00339610 [Synaphobranchus kaupii]|uniref:Uncharacterized protein n=1 Tax=Synaphobranchus kaupii TaxID=118154 RepID=A0A9Q1IID7_SYNKA|nr:hypothetical protein SKAU_G00339610 [Synaphobranchus kaupii]
MNASADLKQYNRSTSPFRQGGYLQLDLMQAADLLAVIAHHVLQDVFGFGDILGGSMFTTFQESNVKKNQIAE